jgi:glutamate/tyrosine decarboxylase-like PLP-dependent enzyme
VLIEPKARVSLCSPGWQLASLIHAAPDLERVVPVALSIVCCRSAPEHLRGEGERLDELNTQIREERQVGGNAFVNATLLGGLHILRSCALHDALTSEDVEAIVEEVSPVGARCLAQAG